ncbi:MAG TPA: ATP-binding protein, partial [Candidatus Saccharimonadales bacterium]|nr:ATP-binding protein [Candidatus Saccharimonadales bacterium]
TNRPFRAPHHSASVTAVTGGGAQLRPGEMSLAHRGVLFFDELPEFGRETLETLRQPLEDRTITITRAQGTARYPAHFIFVATANPCPCGYHGYEGIRSCACSEAQVNSYRQRLSGPVLDRIDLHSSVHEVDHAALLAGPSDPEDEEAVARKHIREARRRQAERFGTPAKLNADMTNADLRQLRLEPEALSILTQAARSLGLSARGYLRTIKVAQTIADLEASPVITGAHLADALNYRPGRDAAYPDNGGV